jgi:hypothetical protein
LSTRKGVRHKIDAYVSINPGDWFLMLRCVFTFGAVGIGFECPETIFDQFSSGQPWDDTGNRNIVGGHYVPIVGTQEPTSECSCITWGRKQRMTRKFYETFNDESWVPLSREQLRASGFNSTTYRLASLNDDLASL